MAKSELAGTSEQIRKGIRKESPRQSTRLNSTTRIDPPHESDGSASVGSASQQLPNARQVTDEPAVEQIHFQADQLAAHLRDRQKELDRREAELNSRIARFESETRSARLWLNQREADIALRDKVVSTEETCRGRRADLRDVENPLTVHVADPTFIAPDTYCNRNKVDEAEAKLAKAQAELRQIHEQLTSRQQAFDEEIAATRERMAAEHRQSMAEVEQKRLAVQRRAEYVDRCRASLRQVRAELGQMQRETLEIRLSTEELWMQFSGAAPPAALTRSLSRIRSKLAEEYHQANAELAEQRKELEEIRSQLLQQHEKLADQKRQLDRWIADRREELQQQASRLVAREKQIHREEMQYPPAGYASTSSTNCKLATSP